MQLLSWNINGIRAAYKKGFLEWLYKEKPDVLCLQETKAFANQLPDELQKPTGYHSYWHMGERKGYSGVGLLSQKEPISIKTDFGQNNILSHEGRSILADYGEFRLFNLYFPNGKMGQHRLDYKLEFYKEFLSYSKKLIKQKDNLIICGDVNTAHKEIDLARPKANENISGFLPEERKWLDKFISSGLIDTFREFEKGAGFYSWWDMKSRARDRNVGWRIDYFYISKGLRKKLNNAYILSDVMGSDHCPVGIDIF